LRLLALMVSVSQVLQIVRKTTGGRAWIKKWGLPAPTACQKRNRREQRRSEQAIAALLKEAAAREPPQQPAAPAPQQ